MWRDCNYRQRHTSAEAQPYAATAIFRPITDAHTRSSAHANAYSADLDAKHQFSPRSTGPGAASASFIRISNDHLRSR